MLYELEPAEEQTGGLWYTDQELDEDLIKIISSLTIRAIEEASKKHQYLTLSEITNKVRGYGAVKVTLTGKFIKINFDIYICTLLTYKFLICLFCRS